ncbi:MAG: cell wall hydrolase [Acidiferrobacter sp.]
MGTLSYSDGLAVATLWQESRGALADAQAAVAAVIRNRIATQYESDGTIAGTVLKRWQFSGWLSAKTARESLRAVATNGPIVSALAAIWAQSATAPDPTGGAVAYYAPAGMNGQVPRWAPLMRSCGTIGPFNFYGVAS